MRIYSIVDGETEASVGTLLYYEKDKVFFIELVEGLNEWTAPLLLTRYVENGIYTIPRSTSLMWVKERIIPSGRQNIGSILSKHKLKSYDEMKLLELSSGKCSQDSLYIKKIDFLPDYIISRQNRNLHDCLVSEYGYIICFFKDGSARKVELSRLSDIDDVDIDKILKNPELLLSGKLGVGGYYMTFDDAYDIPAEVLYNAGDEISIGYQDFVTFVKRNVFDTTESCTRLGCSRQNISYLVSAGTLSPIKEEVKGNLYLRSDVLRSKW